MWHWRIKSERGGALVATLVLSVLLLGVLVWYLSQASLTAKLQTHEHATEYALHYAESALDLAEQALQFPHVLSSTGSFRGSHVMPHGRSAYTLTRMASINDLNDDPFKPILVEVTATGYSYYEKGQVNDPDTGRRAQTAVLLSKLLFWPVGVFPLASPGRLTLSEGTSVLFGPLYARDLIFVKDSEPPALHGVVEGALFGDTITGGETNPSTTAQKISEIPHFAALGGKVRAYYEHLATNDESRLKHETKLDGRIELPRNNPFPIYYCDGDLTLGHSTPFEPASPVILYVKGNLFIQRSMLGLGNSWAAFLVEKDIVLEPTDATTAMTLRGNFIVNGQVQWKGSKPDPRAFTVSFTGSLLSGRGFDPIMTGLPKKFMRWQVDNALLPLPRFTQRLETRLITGKFRH